MLVESPAAAAPLHRHPHHSGGGGELPESPVPPRTPSLNIQRHKDASPPDVTYSRFVNGSILSVPDSIETAAGRAGPEMGGGVSARGDSLVASVYGFVKYFLR